MKRMSCLLIASLLACSTGCLTIPLVGWDEPPPKKKETEVPQTPPIVVSEDINERNSSKKIQELTKELEFDETHLEKVAPMPRTSDLNK